MKIGKYLLPNEKLKENRISRIKQMLLEMSIGNFFYKLERSIKEDDLEAVTALINMMSEELQESFTHHGFINTNETVKHIVQMSFVLDDSGMIQMINQKASIILATTYDAIIKKPFNGLLTEISKAEWQPIWEKLQDKDIHDTSLALTFKTGLGLVVPSLCYITTFIDKTEKQRKTLITVIHHTTDRKEMDKTLKEVVLEYENNQKSNGKQVKNKKTRLNHDDVIKLRKAHNMIINNLEKEPSTLKEFAHQLGINEYKLKYGFKQLYGTTVCKFLIVERLRKALILIQHSPLTLKSIAQSVGFSSNSHFSKAFKKRYGYTPNILRKQSLN